MIQQMGRLFQQIVADADLYRHADLPLAVHDAAAGALGVLPSFFGETHFAFLGYAKNFRQTPAKR